jgi:hypothetical protein
MRKEDYSQLDELDKKILRYIFQVTHQPSRKDIEAFFFPNLPPGTKTRYMQRKLEYLKDHKYISYHTLEKDKQPSRERGYYLLIKGARAIGVTIKRNHSKVQKKGYYEAKKAKSEITLLSYNQKWEITASEERGREILSEHIKYVIFREGEREPLEADVRRIIPKRIKPDLVIKTASKVIVCTIAHPAGEEQYFRRRAEKYQECNRFFKFVIITINQRQWVNAIRGLRGDCGYIGGMEEKSIPPMKKAEAKPKRFLIVKLTEIHHIPEFL